MFTEKNGITYGGGGGGAKVRFRSIYLRFLFFQQLKRFPPQVLREKNWLRLGSGPIISGFFQQLKIHLRFFPATKDSSSGFFPATKDSISGFFSSN
jgi:hypothetical protein